LTGGKIWNEISLDLKTNLLTNLIAKIKKNDKIILSYTILIVSKD